MTSTAVAQERRPVQSTFEFVAGEPIVESLVRGAPYSAEATTTMTQTLADGTRIERTTYTKIFRDSEGRMRREQTVLGLGALTPTGESTTVVTISDPVSGENYVLEPSSRQARRTMAYRVQGRGGAGGAGDRVTILRQKVEDALAPPPPPQPPSPGEPPGPARAAASSSVRARRACRRRLHRRRLRRSANRSARGGSPASTRSARATPRRSTPAASATIGRSRSSTSAGKRRRSSCSSSRATVIHAAASSSIA
jgi:hypothetical protein